MKNSARKGNAKNKSGKSKSAAESRQAAIKKRGGQEKDVIYCVKTKRDADVIKAYITFTYRMFHPKVTSRLMIAAVMFFIPVFVVKEAWLKGACIALGVIFLLLALFRQYISVALTKKNDPDFRSGTEFRYEFTDKDATFYKGDEVITYVEKYKEITGFYYDDKYYYLALRNRDFYIIPKSRFTKGSADEFEDFIYRRCKKACIWIPNDLKGRLAKWRAARAADFMNR